MGDRLGIRGAVDILKFLSPSYIICQNNSFKKFAPGEARTHGLQIMRLTRCLLRYRGYKIFMDKMCILLRSAFS